MKVLIAGLGGIGQRHVRNLRKVLGSDVEILAYRVRNFDRVLTETLEIKSGECVSDLYDIRTFDRLERALLEQPKAVFVCNPTSMHLSVATMAAHAGCHLFVEKPLSHDLEGIESLVALVNRRGLKAMVGYQLRFHPLLIQLRSMLKEGTVGRLLAVNVEVGEFLPGWHKYEDYREMYASRSKLGGGVVLSQIHELDYLYSLFGMPRRVFAFGGHLSSLEVDVEDIVSTLLEFEIEGRLIPVHLHQDYLQRPPSRTCKVIGDTGKIVVDFGEPSLRVYDFAGKLTETRLIQFQRNQLFIDELTHFLACLESDAQPVVTLRDGAQSLRIALAIKESMQSSKVVEL